MHPWKYDDEGPSELHDDDERPIEEEVEDIADDEDEADATWDIEAEDEGEDAEQLPPVPPPPAPRPVRTPAPPLNRVPPNRPKPGSSLRGQAATPATPREVPGGLPRPMAATQGGAKPVPARPEADATTQVAEIAAGLLGVPRNTRLKMVENRARGAALRRLDALLGREKLERWLKEHLELGLASARNYMLLDELWGPLQALIASGDVEGIDDIEQLSTQKALKLARDRGLVPSRRGGADGEGTTDAPSGALAGAQDRKARGRRRSTVSDTAPAVPPGSGENLDLRELVDFVAAARRGEAAGRPLFGGITLGDFLLALLAGRDVRP